jgi:hypothetical protein
MQHEVNEFMQYVKREMVKGLGDWEQRLSTALVKSSPSGLVRAEPRPAPPPVDPTRSGTIARKSARDL